MNSGISNKLNFRRSIGTDEAQTRNTKRLFLDLVLGPTAPRKPNTLREPVEEKTCML